MMRLISGFLSLLFLAAASCSGAKKGPTVLVETERRPDAEPRVLIEERIEADARRAAAVLRESVASSDPRVAGWAAVHGLRLGIHHDDEGAFAALVEATRSVDPLLRTLAWRWLAVAPNSVSLPPALYPEQAPNETTAEEVVFASLATSSRGDKTALSRLLAPTGDCVDEPVSSETTKKNVEQLFTLAQPYAGLELALVTAFVQARRSCHVEVVAEGPPRPTFNRLLSEALAVMGIADEVPSDTQAEPDILPRRDLVERLANPLSTRGRGVAVSAAVTADDPKLRVAALDALCILAPMPLAGDFGAAAAALEAPSPEVAVAGARTFLLLVTRARRSPEQKR